MLHGSDQRVAYPTARVQFDYLRGLRDEPDMREPFDIINRRMLKCSVKALRKRTGIVPVPFPAGHNFERERKRFCLKGRLVICGTVFLAYQ